MSDPVQASTMPPDGPDRARYYAAALRALRFVERRALTTRPFGSEADARWGAFRGNLTTADRLDLLLRDADAHSPAAFGARNVFALRAAAEDEAFGAAWSPLDPVDAEELWRKGLTEAQPEGVWEPLLAVASSWELQLDLPQVGAIAPTDKLLVVGPSAIAAVVTALAEGADLDWADQVVCVATPPRPPAARRPGRRAAQRHQAHRAPRVEPLIFLSSLDIGVRLGSDSRLAVVGRKELLAALTRHEFPGAPPGWRAERIDQPLAADIAQALAAIGIRKRKGKLYAGAYELGPLLDDGIFQTGGGADESSAPSGYQDRLATHRDTPGLSRRARVYLVPQQTTVARRQLLRRAADREVQLLYGVREHPNVLTFVEHVTDAPLGPTVLFDAFEGGQAHDAVLPRVSRGLGARRRGPGAGAVSAHARLVALPRPAPS